MTTIYFLPIRLFLGTYTIRGLIQELEIPCRLRDFNVSKESNPLVVRNILMDIQGEENTFGSEKDLKEEITTLIEPHFKQNSTCFVN